MALKYFIDFDDIEDINHRVEISNDDYVGDPIEITGNIIYSYPEINDILQPVRGSGLTLDLDASINQNFTDFVGASEFSFSVVYERNSTIEFRGFIKPEGVFQSYVEDNWIISINCVDGLDYLKNLAYVDSTTFVPFTGNQSAIEIISNCLKRTGVLQDIYVDINILYTGYVGNNILSNVFFNSDRFQKEDESTIMNCDEVLKSILDIFTASIVQQQGAWWIFKPNQITFGNNDPIFSTYDFDGSLTGSFQYDIFQDLGSQIDSFYPHWANANQRISYKNSIGAYRINYKYGFVKSFISNILLQSISDVNIPEYTINDGSFLTFPADRFGVIINSLSDGADLVLTSDSSLISTGDKIEFKTRFTTEIESDCSYAVFAIVLTGGVDTYYLQTDGSWTTAFTQLRIFNGTPNGNAIPPEQPFVGTGAELQYINTSQEAPESGDIEVQIYTGGIFTPGGDNAGTVIINEVSLSPIPLENNIVGEFHTVQRSEVSSKIENNKEVFNGDTPSDVYIGTIYQSDGTTPTETWYREGEVEAKPILQIMGEETLRMYQLPSAVFDGDIYGYFNYLSSFIINKYPIEDQTFLPLKMIHDVKQNISTLKLKQMYSDELEDIEYAKTFDYGQTVKPTIVG